MAPQKRRDSRCTREIPRPRFLAGHPTWISARPFHLISGRGRNAETRSIAVFALALAPSERTKRTGRVIGLWDYVTSIRARAGRLQLATFGQTFVKRYVGNERLYRTLRVTACNVAPMTFSSSKRSGRRFGSREDALSRSARFDRLNTAGGGADTRAVIGLAAVNNISIVTADL